MRLAYVCADPGIPVFGAKGASIHVQEVIRAFRRQGLQVRLFAMRLGGEPPADLRDLPVHCLPEPPRGRHRPARAGGHGKRRHRAGRPEDRRAV